MNHLRTPGLKPLLDDLPQGFIVDPPWLKARGIDSKSLHNYVKQGWLERIIRGVYRRPLPTGAKTEKVPWRAVLVSLQHLMGYDVHLGGRDALDLAGHAHFLTLGEGQLVHLYGSVPSWIKRLPTTGRFVLHKTTLFGDDPVGIVSDHSVGSQKDWMAGIWCWPIRASSPERAILELIADLKSNPDVEYVELYFQTLVYLRPNFS